MLIAVYFFLVDGPAMIENMMRLSPLADDYERELVGEFANVSRAVVLATLLSAVVQGLMAAGVDVAVVSASNRWVIEVAVAELGVTSERVVAVDLVRAAGRLTSEVVQPMPNGQGKVGAIDAVLGRRPALAFGNSLHDVPMLDCASAGVLVLATTPEQEQLTPSLEAQRVASGWEQLLVPHPLRG